MSDAKVTINGIDCYGTARIGANYEVTFDDEYKDFVADDIEATNWNQVVNALSKFDGIVEIVAD